MKIDIIRPPAPPVSAVVITLDATEAQTLLRHLWEQPRYSRLTSTIMEKLTDAGIQR